MDAATVPEPSVRPSASAVRTARAVRVTVGRVRRRLREHYDRAELTSSQTAVLGRLDREGPLTAAELAAAEGVRPQSMSATVAVLLERGMVTRAADPTDGRRLTISLTDEARTLLGGFRQEGEGWLAGVIEERLTAAERERVEDAMALLERAVRP